MHLILADMIYILSEIMFVLLFCINNKNKKNQATFKCQLGFSGNHLLNVVYSV